MARSTSWKFYLSSAAAWEGMYQACEQAHASIDCEQYIFEDDFLGRRFCELFLKKAKSGVSVRLLIDSLGSYSMHYSPMVRELRAAGVQILFFNSIQPWWRWVYRLTQKFLRTHRKLLIIDQASGFIGGVGIRATMADRRDTHIRIRGPVVHQMSAAFERMWQMTAAGRRLFTFAAPGASNDDFLLLTNSPHYRQRFTYWTLVRKFRSARKYIYLTTPYFVPDMRILRALRGAARRGVEVRLILPERSDHVFTDLAARSYFARLLRAGVRIYLHSGQFIHSKTYIVDDSWATVGSSNLDNLSLLFNYEADIASTNKEFVKEVKWQFVEDTKNSIELDRLDWRQRSWFAQWAELAIWPLHRFL